MNIFAQKMSEGGRIQQFNVRSGLNLDNSSSFDKFTFDSLVKGMKSGGADQSSRPERVNYQDDYSRYERISRRSRGSSQPEKLEMQKEINDRQYNYKSEGIDDRRYENRAGEVNSGPENRDGNNDTVNKKHDPDTLETGRDYKKAAGGSGEKSIEESGLTEGDSSLDVQSAETLVDESETALNGDGEGVQDDAEIGTALQTDTLLALLINSGAEGLTDTSQAGNGNSLKTLGSGSESKAGGELNGKLVTPENTDNRPLTVSEIKETVGSESKMTENKSKSGVLITENPSAFVDEDGNDAEKTLGGARPKPANQDAQNDRAREIKSIDDMTGPDFREGGNAAKPLTEKQLSEYALNFNREAGMKSNSNADARAMRVESANGDSGLLNNSVATHQSGKVSEVMNAGNAARPTSFAEAVDKIVYVVKGDNRLGVTIEHKDLGKLNINLSLEKGVVNVHINAADKAVREFVENNIQQIIDSLSKNGVSIGGFSVGLRKQGNSEGNENGNGKSDKNAPVAGRGEGYLDLPNHAPLNNGQLSIFA